MAGHTDPQIMSPTVECPVCRNATPRDLGALPTRAFFAGAPFNAKAHPSRLYACPKCSLRFRFPLLSAAAYRRLYDNGIANNWDEPGPRADWQIVAEAVNSRATAGARVLDFGCNTGRFLELLNGQYQRFGIEVSAAAAELARGRGICVWACLDEIPCELKFDCVVLIDVIEHFGNPEDTLRALEPFLTEDAVIYIATGDADAKYWRTFGPNWWYCFYPEHLSFISHAWLQFFAARNAYDVIDFSRFRHHEPSRISWLVQGFLMLLFGCAPNFFVAVTGPVMRFFGRAPASWAPGNGVTVDHFLAVLRKSRNTRAISTLQ